MAYSVFPRWSVHGNLTCPYVVMTLIVFASSLVERYLTFVAINISYFRITPLGLEATLLRRILSS
jgi:hypothetical protein